MSSTNIDLLLEELEEIEKRREIAKRLRTSSEWTEEQTNRFINCIKSQITSNHLNSGNSIDWDLVSKQMDRSVAKCKSHWFKKIRFQFFNADVDCWHHLYDTSRLICYIYANNYDNEQDIDWDFLKEKFAKYSIFVLFFNLNLF
jgi:hypothetical protein